MMHNSFSLRQSMSDSERRLCMFSIVDRVSEAAGAVVDFGKEWGKWGLEQTAGGYYGIKEQMKTLWHIDTRNDLKEEKMQNISQFFELASPDMLKLLDDQFKNGESVNSLSELADLLDHPAWIDAYSQPDLFDETKTPVKSFTMREGPLGVLLGLPAAERKRLFAGYVDRFVPQEIQKNNTAIFPSEIGDPAHEDDVVNNKNEITDAMRLMLGVGDAPLGPDPSGKIATEVLQNRYRYLPGTVDEYGVEVRNRANLRADYDKATGGIPIFRDIRDVQHANGASLLRGAAKLGILKEEDIKEYSELARNRERDRHAQLHDPKYMELTKVTKKEIQREAASIADRFSDMGSFEKLALVVAGLYAVSLKPVRNMALAGAGYYYLAKLFGGVDKPLEPFAKGIQGGTSMFFNMPGIKGIRESLGITTKMTTEEAVERGSITSQFLSKDAKEQMDPSVTGLRLLFDMPMKELAQYVELGGVTGMGHKGLLRTWDPNFQKRGREILGARGLDKRAIDNFFSDPSRASINLTDAFSAYLKTKSVHANALETGDALATVYYLVGAKDASPEDVQLVDAARDESGGSYDAIPHGTRAKELFFDIADAGKENAPDITLGNFMAERMGLLNPPEARAEALKDAEFTKQRVELEAHEHLGEKANLSAKDKGNVVEIGLVNGLAVRAPISGPYLKTPIDGYNLDFPLTMPKEEFLKKNSKELAIEWMNSALAKHKTDTIAAIPIGYTYGTDFDAKPSPTDAELIRFAPVIDVNAAGITLPLAETSAYKFLQAKSADIVTKYEEYEKLIAAGTPPASKDPL